MKAIGLGNTGYNEQFHKQVSEVISKHRELKSMKPEMLPDAKNQEAQAIIRDAGAIIKKYDEKQKQVFNTYLQDNQSQLMKSISPRN